MRSKFKITYWVQHPIDSHPFHSKSFSPPIPEIWLYQNLTLKIQVQGHNSRSPIRSNILTTYIHFIPHQSLLPFLRYGSFKIWPCKSSQGPSSMCYSGSNILSPHILFVSCQLALPFLRCHYLKIWLNSGSNILWTHIPFIPCQSQSGSDFLLTHTHFGLCQSSIPFLGYGFFLNLILKIQGQGHSSRSHNGSDFLSPHIPFITCQSAIPF